MSISYEAVAYGNGTVTIGDPEGFGFEHYDQTPSSLQPGDGTRQESPSFNGSLLNSQEIINTVSSQLNTYLNTKENQNTSSSKLVSQLPETRTGGLQGFNFPQINFNIQQNNNVIVAKQVNLNINNGR